MAMGRESDRQGDLIVTWDEMPRSPGHVFYDRLQEVLLAGGFDRFVETACQPYYAPKMGAPSVPPGRYFRMHMIGYFEGIASDRGIAWRCSDSMSLRDFLRLESREKVPDHSWLSKTRGRRAVEVPHRRTQAARLFTLARRRQGPCGGLRKPHPPGFAGRQEGDAAAGGNRRAILRPQSRPRRHAPDLAAPTLKTSTSAIWSTSPDTISAS